MFRISRVIAAMIAVLLVSGCDDYIVNGVVSANGDGTGRIQLEEYNGSVGTTYPVGPVIDYTTPPGPQAAFERAAEAYIRSRPGIYDAERRETLSLDDRIYKIGRLRNGSLPLSPPAGGASGAEDRPGAEPGIAGIANGMMNNQSNGATPPGSQGQPPAPMGGGGGVPPFDPGRPGPGDGPPAT